MNPVIEMVKMIVLFEQNEIEILLKICNIYVASLNRTQLALVDVSLASFHANGVDFWGFSLDDQCEVP